MARACYLSMAGAWCAPAIRSPPFTLRFEAYTRPQIAEYLQVFKAQLDNYPQIDQSKFLAQVEAFAS